MSDEGLASGSSEALTQGVRVQVISQYVPERSDPRQDLFFFGYRVRIQNEGSETVRLLSRHWTIVDGLGREEHVRGPGVIGLQPRLAPGQTHEYTSACPLPTPGGSMWGTYTMLREGDGQTFEARIGAFSLLAPQMLN